MEQMLRINLLDWRQARREQRKRQFFVALAATALAAVAVIGTVLFAYGSALDQQEARNRFLEQEITKVDKQIEEIRELEETRDNLITRMRIIEELQRSRARIVHYFDQVVDTLPEGVYLTGLEQNGETTTVEGVAESNGRVSAYMVNLDDSPWFDNPQLVVIESKSGQPRRFADFTLKFKTTPPDEDADDTVAASDAGGGA